MVRQRLLVAVTPLGYVHARRALQRRFDLVCAFSIAQAMASLKGADVDAIVCSIHFDECRMFDFLTQAMHLAPDMPVVCCQILRSPLSPQAIDGLMTTAKSLGCRGFVNFNALQRSHGLEEADRRFCEAVSDLLLPHEEKRNASTG